jgi:cation diffusion facilitator CzcD-associated flavoprotein CzcO
LGLASQVGWPNYEKRASIDICEGMCMAVKLLEKKIGHFVVLEKSDGIGGTWKDNTYPGSCCDSKIVSRFLEFHL